jgi:OOP family OmpA-OmpF porin
LKLIREQLNRINKHQDSNHKVPMKSSILALAILSTFTIAAQAAPNDGIVGPYARIEVGRSNFDLANTLPQGESDDRGQAVKFFGGYRVTENFGVEAGYAALGSFTKTVIVGGAGVKQDGKARSVFGVATGRLPVAESFALHGRVGVSFGEVSGTNVLPDSDNLMGSQTSVMFGLGAEYRPRPNVALTINYDNYGKVSDNVKASALVFGLHFTL